jgi:hypothetical protein
MAASGDTVTLRVPRERTYLPLLHMVLGGIAIRQDLSFDDLDDVQLAVDNVVAEDDGAQQELTMTVTVDDDALTIRPARDAAFGPGARRCRGSLPGCLPAATLAGRQLRTAGSRPGFLRGRAAEAAAVVGDDRPFSR